MLDPKECRENAVKVAERICLKGDFEREFNSYLSKDKQWRHSLAEIDALKQQRNSLTPKGKPTDEQRQQLKQLSENIKQRQDQVSVLEKEVKELALMLPNTPLKEVPIGNDESDNVVVRTVGDLPDFDFKPKSHETIGEELGILNSEQAVKVTGSRFMVYHRQGAALERALINFMLDTHVNDHGYSEVHAPAIVQSRSLVGTGQLPKFSDDLFKLEGGDYWLSPTAEVQLTNLFSDQIIHEDQLPVSVTAHTPCFRKEAGSYGKDLKGLIRLHQFNKVELVKVVSPEESSDELERLLKDAESILKRLELPYRVVSLCTGDLGFSAAKTYDLEVWFPSQGCYREISSCSNFLDFQSRRAMIRCKRKGTGNMVYLHTLNGSGLAVGRTLAAILENFQSKDGTVAVPECLRGYTRFEKVC
ncbi:serine--tRNA ligase [bacterium]|nr:serine--tRNA ligase [bacterium]